MHNSNSLLPGYIVVTSCLLENIFNGYDVWFIILYKELIDIIL